MKRWMAGMMLGGMVLSGITGCVQRPSETAALRKEQLAQTVSRAADEQLTQKTDNITDEQLPQSAVSGENEQPPQKIGSEKDTQSSQKANDTYSQEEQQLIQKASGLEDEQATIAGQTGAPASVQDSFAYEGDKLAVEMDAKVVLPEGKKSQIIRVSSHEFTQSEVDLWTDQLFGGQTLYETEGFSKMTKSEAQAELEKDRQELARLKASKEGDKVVAEAAVADGEEESDPSTAVTITAAEDLEKQIAYLEEYILTAPEKREFKETTNQLLYHSGQDFTWTQFAVPHKTGTGLVGMNVANNAGFHTLTYVNREGAKWVTEDMLYTYDQIVAYETEGMKQEKYQNIPEPEMTETEAKTLGDAFISQMHIQDMTLARADRAVSELSEEDNSACTVKGWKLEYTRSVDGIPVTFTGLQGAYPEDEEWWAYERLTLFLTDDGVSGAYYVEPYEKEEVLCGNCKLMEFTSIMEIFQKMMGVIYSDIVGDVRTEQQRLCHVSSVEFGYTRITEDNGEYSGFLVPSWTFCGSKTDTYRVSYDNIEHTDTWIDQTFLTINAIDGSIIDIEKGY